MKKIMKIKKNKEAMNKFSMKEITEEKCKASICQKF
jgi:hypothetical protein